MRLICSAECLCRSARLFTACALISLAGFAQTDPGPRGGTSAAGGPVAGLSSYLMAVFQQGSDQFQQVEMVADGLGPRFNSNSCSACHAQPAADGTSPQSNPQVQFANARNPLPPFITANGPVRRSVSG